jgi:hypothetical protein
MNNLQLLEQLDQDPDGYWVAYDLKMTLGWADLTPIPTAWYLYSNGYLFRCLGFATDTHNSRYSGSVDSTAGGHWTSGCNKIYGSSLLLLHS